MSYRKDALAIDTRLNVVKVGGHWFVFDGCGGCCSPAGFRLSGEAWEYAFYWVFRRDMSKKMSPDEVLKAEKVMRAKKAIEAENNLKAREIKKAEKAMRDQQAHEAWEAQEAEGLREIQERRAKKEAERLREAQKPFTPSFKKGQPVEFYGCYEAMLYRNTNLICAGDSFLAENNKEAVFLEGLESKFFCDFIQPMNH